MLIDTQEGKSSFVGGLSSRIFSIHPFWRLDARTKFKSELADEPDHHAEDLERAFRAYDRISLVFGPQHELPAFEIQALQGELVVDDRDDDFALLRGDTFFDDDEVAIENAGILHRIALHADEHRRGWAVDQVIIDRDGIRFVIVYRIGQPGTHRPCGERAGREPAGRGNAPIGGRV